MTDPLSDTIEESRPAGRDGQAGLPTAPEVPMVATLTADSFALKLLTALTASGLSKAAASRELDISIATFRNYEKGITTPPLDRQAKMLRKLADHRADEEKPDASSPLKPADFIGEGTAFPPPPIDDPLNDPPGKVSDALDDALTPPQMPPMADPLLASPVLQAPVLSVPVDIPSEMPQVYIAQRLIDGRDFWLSGENIWVQIDSVARRFASEAEARKAIKDYADAPVAGYTPQPDAPSAETPDGADLSAGPWVRWNRVVPIKRLPTHFGVLITAATQAELDHPRFRECCASWASMAKLVRVLIPSDARVDEPKGVQLIRLKSRQVFLRDLTDLLASSVGPLYMTGIICDPLVAFGPALRTLIDPEFVMTHQIGNAWFATSQAIKLDATGEGGALESEVLRFFVGAENAVRQIAKYVDTAMPFQPGLWAAGFAGLLQAKVSERRYFHLTGMNVIASWMPPPPAWSGVGFTGLTLNPPVKTFPELKAE